MLCFLEKTLSKGGEKMRINFSKINPCSALPFITLMLMFLFAPLSVANAATVSELPCDANGDNKLTDEEVCDAICDYMAEDSTYTLDDVKDASYILKFWNGTPKKISDYNDREVTLYRPVNRIITTNPDNSRIVIALGDIEKLVATDECTRRSSVLPRDRNEEKIATSAWESLQVYGGGQLDSLPETNTRKEIDYETMAMLQPDLVLDATWYDRAELVEEKVGCPCVVAGAEFKFEYTYAHIRMLGEILDKQDRAEELVEFIQSKVDMVNSITSEIDENEKPIAYFAPRGAKQGFFDAVEGRDFTRTEAVYEPLDIAGGINVAKDVVGDKVNVQPEQIVAWNPEVIFIAWQEPEESGGPTGVDFVMQTPELSNIPAIQNNKVFSCVYPYSRGMPFDRCVINMLYMAKCMYPEEFSNLDLEAEGNELYKQILGVDEIFSELKESWTFLKSVC